MNEVKSISGKSGAALLMMVLGMLAGCHSKGSSAPAPTNVAVVAGDSSATVTWDKTPGVEYWVFLAPAAGVTPQSCSGISGCQIITAAQTPLIIASPYNGGSTGFTNYNGLVGLTNGSTYSISINGRIDNGPGGPGSAAVSFVPRLAGTTWVAKTAGTNDLHGVASGTATLSGVTGDVYVAAGNAGALYASSDGLSWSNAVSGVPATSNNLNAAAAYGTLYLAAGQGGAIITSTDAQTWTLRTSGTANDLYGVAGNGSGGFVAVGDGGTILYSNGNSGTGWTAATSPTANRLYGVSYANGGYVAVGASGTILTGSADGSTWSKVTPSPATTADLKAMAWGGASVTGGVTSGTNTYVIVGANGALVTSTDNGASWVTQSAIAAGINFSSVVYGHQFIAVGDGGNLYTSLDGLSWQAQNSGTTAPLYVIGKRKFDYVAAGQAGVTLSAK